MRSVEREKKKTRYVLEQTETAKAIVRALSHRAVDYLPLASVGLNPISDRRAFKRSIQHVFVLFSFVFSFSPWMRG